MSKASFILLTCHQTLIDIDEKGDIIQHSARILRVLPRFFLDEQGLIKEPILIGSATHCQIEKVKGSNSYALKLNGQYISAMPNGDIALALLCRGWETFRLVNYDAEINLPERQVPDLPLKPRHRCIPRVMHQTSRQSSLPLECEDNVLRLRKLNEGWTYNYWSDKDAHDFIYEYYGWDILSSYFRISAGLGAARADLFRYLLIYQVGGIYLDVKSSTTRPFDKILRHDDEYLLSHWKNGEGERYAGYGLHADLEKKIANGEYQQWHIMAAAGHPFLEAVIIQVLRNIGSYKAELDGTGWLGVLRTTGPIAYSLAIHKIREKHTYRLIDAQEAGLLYQAVPRPENNVHYSMISAPVVT